MAAPPDAWKPEGCTLFEVDIPAERERRPFLCSIGALLYPREDSANSFPEESPEARSVLPRFQSCVRAGPRRIFRGSPIRARANVPGATSRLVNASLVWSPHASGQPKVSSIVSASLPPVNSPACGFDMKDFALTFAI